MSFLSHQQQLTSLFARPTVERFRELQAVAFAAEGYDPLAWSVRQLESSLPSARPTDLLDAWSELPWWMGICPRYHFVEARIREHLGEVARMEQAVQRMQCCLELLLETGDGTPAAPIEMTFVTDERDCLRVLGGRLRFQEMVHQGRQCFDVLTREDGSELWFDVTQAQARLHAAAAASQTQLVDPG